MKATDLNLSEMPAMTLHGPDGFGLTQYSGDEYALVGGFRDGASNAGELRLKYQIYSHALIAANDGNFEKGEIGYCVVRVASDDGPDQGEILGLIDIELKPKYRKSGHGKKIVRDIVDTTKSGNLDIHDIQKKAKKFWDKMGVEYDAKKPGAKNAVLRKQDESTELDESVVADLVAQTGQTPAEIYYQLTLLAAAVGGSLYVAGMLFAMHIEDIIRDNKKWKEYRKNLESNPELVKRDLEKAKKTPGIMAKAKSLLSFFKNNKATENQEQVDEDIASVAEVAAMAAVAGLAAPVMMAMIKAAYKTGKGINAIRKIANRAGVKLADRVMGETFTDKQALSLYNPDSKTYRYTTGGGRIPNSKSISKQDITVKGQRTDFPDDTYEPDMLAGVNKEQLEKAVADSLSTLTKREEMVIRARFGLKPFTQDHTLKQVGDAMGVGKERLRQIEAKALRKLKHPKRSSKLRGFMDEQLDDFNKDEPNKSTVVVPGYGTMNVDSLMKNIIDQTTQMVKQMQSGAQGFRNADYALNSNKVLPTKVAALVKALDDLQAIRSKGGANSRNIQQEADAQQQLPIDVNKIMGNIQEFESKQYITPEDADLMRRGIQSLATPRQTVNPNAILQLLTMVTR